jgi:hypothetical protein
MDALFSFSSPAVDPASVNAFANVAIMFPDQRCSGPSLTPPTSGPISVNWKNTGANSIDTRVLGTNDPNAADADCDVVLASAALAAGIVRHAQINPAYYAYYRFQHRATVGGSQGASKISGCQKRI